MKAVQVGILVALVVCAGLLFKVYRGQQAPVATPAAAVQPVPATAEPAAPMPQPAAAPEASHARAQAAAPASEPAKPQKPSPARASKRERAEVAQSRAPEPAQAIPQPDPVSEQIPQPAPIPQSQPLTPPSGAQAAPPAPREPHHVTIPAGTSVTVRLAETLSTQKNQPGDSFSATLDQPLIVDGFAIAERGARVQGKIAELQQAGRVRGVAQLALLLTRIHTSDGQDVAVSTERFEKQGPTSHGSDAKKVGIGAALGAAIGAIAGGGKGAAIGAGVGGGAGAGTVAATRGKPAELPVETRLTFRLQEPVTITERLR